MSGFKYKASLITGIMEKGYDGVVMDVMSMSPHQFNMADAFTSCTPRNPWNFETSAPYEVVDWLHGVELHLQALYDETTRKPAVSPTSCLIAFKATPIGMAAREYSSPSGFRRLPLTAFSAKRDLA